MRPTEQAEWLLLEAQLTAGRILDLNDAPRYARELALAISALGGGLRHMSIGLRATYMLLEQVKAQLDKSRTG